MLKDSISHSGNNLISSKDSLTKETTINNTVLEKKSDFAIKHICPFNSKQIINIPSSFKENILKPINKGYLNNGNILYNWELGIIILVLIIYSYIKFNFNRVFKSIISTFVFYRAVGKLSKEENPISFITVTTISFTYIIIFSLFILKIFKLYNLSFPIIKNDFLIFLIIALLVVVFYSLKLLILVLSGIIFKTEKVVNEYIFNLFLYNTVISLFTIPFIIVTTYVNDTSYLINGVSFLLVLMFIFKIARGISIITSNIKISKLYLFLYLCTVEFLPILFVGKYITLNM